MSLMMRRWPLLTVPPKARADDFALYALAQARVAEVQQACGGCHGCPGPGAPDGCETRRVPRVVAGRADWPLCPLGMLRVPAWRDIVDLKVAAKVSPISGFPDCLTAGAFRALLELHDAIMSEDQHQMRSATSGSSGEPVFSGRRAARGGVR